MRTLKKTLCLVLCLAMMAGLCCVAASADFNDAAEIKNEKAVAVLTGIGVINGIEQEDGTFNFDPTGTLTRAQACKIITYLLGDEDLSYTCSFTDCQGHWAEGYIAYCAKNEIVAGYGDGTFGPDAKLTGAAWAKMLLCALGYKAENEGMVGAGWEIAVAKLAKKTELIAGLEKFDGAAEISRDDACLLAYNALTIPMVDYDSNGVTIKTGDVEIITNEDLYYTEETLKGNNFSTLNLNATYTDEYGETYNQVTYGRPTKVIYSKNAGKVVTFTAPVASATALKKALGTDKIADAVKATYADLAAIAAVTGNGIEVRVEVTTGATGKVVTNVVVVPTVFGKLETTAHKATTTTGAYTTYKVDTLSGDIYSTVVDAETETDTATLIGTVAKGDIVAAYYLADGNLAIAELDTVSGKVNAKSSAGVYTIGADKYELTTGALVEELTVAPKADEDSTFYVDRFGYVVGVKAAPKAELPTVYALVADVKPTYALNTFTGATEVTYTASLVLADGTVQDVIAAKGNRNSTSCPVAKDDVVKVGATDKSTGVTALTAESGLYSGTTAFTSKTLATGKYVNNSTVFVSANYTKNPIPGEDDIFAGTATVVNGFANMKPVTSATVVAIDTSKTPDGIADIVFIKSGANPLVKIEDTYVYVVPGYTSFDGEVYTYDAIIKGEETTITVDDQHEALAGLYSLILTLNGETTAVPAGATELYKIANIGGFVALNGTIVPAVSAAADVPVYVFNADGELTEKTFADLTTAVSGDVYLVTEDTLAGPAVTAVYVMPATAHVVSKLNTYRNNFTVWTDKECTTNEVNLGTDAFVGGTVLYLKADGQSQSTSNDKLPAPNFTLVKDADVDGKVDTGDILSFVMPAHALVLGGYIAGDVNTYPTNWVLDN